MSVGFAGIKGLTYCARRKAYAGVTVFAPMEGTGVYMLDMLGRVVKHWEMGYKPGCYGELLPNTHVLYAGRVEDGPLADLEGAGGILLEVDWDGNKVWEYKDSYLHHGFYRMKNGNTLVLKWVEVPKDIAANVKGGDTGTERNGVMWGDVIQEITPQGKVAWEWIGHEHLDPADNRCLLCPRSTWTHANSVAEMADGNILVCLTLLNEIAIIDKRSGDIKWRWGAPSDLARPGFLAHPHCPTVLDNGHILVFDNGLHPNGIECGSSVVEVNPENSKEVWGYVRGFFSEQYFFSTTMGSAQRLPDGNTLICEGIKGRIFEITSEGELAWEYVNNLPLSETFPAKFRHYPVCAAFRYGMDYSGLKRSKLAPPEARQPAMGMPASSEEKVGEETQKRLAGLGYR